MEKGLNEFYDQRRGYHLDLVSDHQESDHQHLKLAFFGFEIQYIESL